MIERPRRLRGNSILREAIAETHIGKQNLMLPVFVADIKDDREITGMPGVMQHSIASLCRRVEKWVESGLKSFIIFGVPAGKDAQAGGAVAADGIVPRALSALRKAVGNAAFLCTDVCVCSYTSHGHCGIVREDHAEIVDNDASIELLADMALTHARAGADMVAPSDMMDGRVGKIRERLDANSFHHLPIMSYAVKYASRLYGPFRHAADSSPKFGDRRGYQMDFRNARDAQREARLDENEGADLLMVKPGIAYLDIVQTLRRQSQLPIAVYQVSGEYAMIRYAALANAIDEAKVCLELWHGMRRAGADILLSYHADQAIAQNWLD